MKNKIKYCLTVLKRAINVYNILHNCKFYNNRCLGDIVRNTHSIEKGLSLANVRLGFGYEKILNAFNNVRNYQNNGGDMHAEELMMFVNALETYIDFHKNKDYVDDKIILIGNYLSALKKEVATDNTNPRRAFAPATRE